MLAMSQKEIRWPTFGAKFTELLEKTGVTTYELDENTELRSSNLSKIKAGTLRATDRTMSILARYKRLDISFLELLEWRLADEEPEVDVYEGIDKLVQTHGITKETFGKVLERAKKIRQERE